MNWIFFDLETSGLYRVDQILSYCFVYTDDKHKEISRLSGKIKLNNVLLPSPYAIFCNKLCLNNHQKTSDSEKDGILKIYNYLNDIAKKNKRLYISGYNIAAFDIPFLSSSLKKYGLNWPSSEKFVIHDLMVEVKNLKIANKAFQADFNRRKISNLKLSSLVKSYLAEEQDHSSDNDIRQVIDLYKVFDNYISVDNKPNSRIQESFKEYSSLNDLPTDVEDCLYYYPVFSNDYSPLAETIYKNKADGFKYLEKNSDKFKSPIGYEIAKKLYMRYLIKNNPKDIDQDVLLKFLKYFYSGSYLKIYDVFRGVQFYPSLDRNLMDLEKLKLTPLNDIDIDVVDELIEFYKNSESVKMLVNVDGLDKVSRKILSL